MSRRQFNYIFIFFDILAVGLTYFGALYLRYDGVIPAYHLKSCLAVTPVAIIITVLTYYSFGLYKKLWQYASVRELHTVLRGVTTASLLVIVVSYTAVYHYLNLSPLPRSVFLTSWLLNLIFTGGSRFWLRSVREYQNGLDKGEQKDGRMPMKKKSVLIIGAGDAGAMVVRELRNHPSLGLIPVGFIDDDRGKQGMHLLNVPILGMRHDIPRVVMEQKVDEIIMAMPSAHGGLMREIVAICKTTGADLKTVPGVYELIGGKVTVSQIRQVELEDLLGREPVQLDLEEIAGYLAGKVVLVTGAGGSIGSELCRQIVHYGPSRLILLDNSENNLFEIEQELRESMPEVNIMAELADVRDRGHLEKIFEDSRPNVIFHAAAYKHVPMMERFPQRAVSNNIMGTYTVAALAKTYRAEVFILVSTDKAVRPSSIMGATKRAAELIIQYLDGQNRRDNCSTRYAAVRFGNVLGSRGSVVPIFKRQIAQGGPIKITHPDMVRYFMTIPEAVQLIIQAGALTRGGEIFVLDMGEPIKIVDLARDLIRLSGLVQDEDIEIKFTGIRPGEKLKEELFTDKERVYTTKNSRIYVTQNGDEEPGSVAAIIDKARLGFGLKDAEEAMELLNRLFPALHRRCDDDVHTSIPPQDNVAIEI